MESRPLNVLFLCTGNSARSIMAEVLLNAMGGGRFKAYSAGSHPTGAVNRFAIELLAKNRLPTEGLRSKNWSEFAAPDAPKVDFVFTVCDQAAGEVCPIWAYNELQNRLLIFVNLPLGKLDRVSLQHKLDEIGRIDRPQAQRSSA